MIEEILIIRGRSTKKRRVIFYPIKPSHSNARRYDDPTASSCLRLEKLIRERKTQIYLRDQSVSIWISR